jgi:DNA-binding response OmpR family regulator
VPRVEATATPSRAIRQAAPHASRTLVRPSVGIRAINHAHGTGTGAVPLTVGMIDPDARFTELLARPTRRQECKLVALSDVSAPAALVELGLDALLVDIAATARPDIPQLRRTTALARLAIVACAESSTVAQRISGLRAGLDGWIDLPCHPQETLARLQAIARVRSRRGVEARLSIRGGDLEIRSDHFDVLAHDERAGLTTREFEVLALLAKHEGTVVEREQIYAGVWGQVVPTGDRSVDMFVSRIRRKLQRISPGWSYLHTHPGCGYRFAAERTTIADVAPAQDLALV